LQVFVASPELRLLVGSGIVATYTWLAAYEFWQGRAEALVSRWPAIFILFAHGALFLLHTPLGAVANVSPGSGLAKSGWVELLSLEALLFTISIAFILLAMAKERTEYHHRAAARTDLLTGIANRRGFLEQTALARRGPFAAQPIAVLLFDLDRFKAVNDTHGHAIGDRTLQIFADIARAQIGAAGTMGRWGGDEFVAALHTSREIATTVAERIQLAFEKAARDIDGLPVGATVSSGLAFSSHGAFELSEMLLKADQALYRAKADGRNRLAIALPETAADHEPSSGEAIVAAGSRSAAA
jgi:diguanylate cyclase (GGDEF)-like protein